MGAPAGPDFRGVDLLERESGGQQFRHHFLPFHHEQPQRLPNLFLAEGAQSLDFGLGEHRLGRDYSIEPRMDTNRHE